MGTLADFLEPNLAQKKFKFSSVVSNIAKISEIIPVQIFKSDKIATF